MVLFSKETWEDRRIQCLPKTVAQNSKLESPAIRPLQPVDAAWERGNVPLQQAGGD
jgi:hypothetical protein